MDAAGGVAGVVHGRAVQAVIWGVPAVNYVRHVPGVPGGGRCGEPDGVLVASV